MSRPNWTYDSYWDFWYYGTKENGCGVSTDNEGKSYYGNVVVDNSVNFTDEKNSLEEAQLECEKLFEELRYESRD